MSCHRMTGVAVVPQVRWGKSCWCWSVYWRERVRAVRGGCRDGPFFAPTAGTLDGWLLDSWHGGTEHYDALFMEDVTSASQACTMAHHS